MMAASCRVGLDIIFSLIPQKSSSLPPYYFPKSLDKLWSEPLHPVRLLTGCTIPNFFPAPLLGNGQTLTAGVYSISGAATLNSDLTLDALGNANAVFIFQVQGPLSTNADSKVKLINGAQACKVFWKVEGLVSMASGTTMRGTIIANNAAISMSTGDTLEGRALSTTGAITVD